MLIAVGFLELVQAIQAALQLSPVPARLARMMFARGR